MVVSDESLSLENGAVEAFRKNGKRMNIYYSRILRTFARDFGASYTQPYKDIPKKVRDVLMYGTEAKGDLGTGCEFEGVIPNLQRRFDNTESEWVKARLHQCMSEQPCETCCGTRLKREAMAVRLHTAGEESGTGILPVQTALENGNGKKAKRDSHGQDARATTTVTLPGMSIHDVTQLSVERAKAFFESLKLSAEGEVIAEPIIREIKARLGFMFDVGLGYLTLDRKTGSLSGGEAQRIRLATQVGSGLVGVCYVLDEPTIGLHQRDNARLIRTLLRLRDIGNSVLMVEHDEDCIRSADYLIDIGPGAGAHGGHVVCAGPLQALLQHAGAEPASNTSKRRPGSAESTEVIGNPKNSSTIQYITGDLAIVTPCRRRARMGDGWWSRGRCRICCAIRGRRFGTRRTMSYR